MAGNGNNHKEPDNLLSKVLKIAAYPIGAFSGWWVTRNQVRHYTFQKLRARGGLDDVIAKHETGNLGKGMTDALDAIRTSDEVYDLTHHLRPAEREYSRAIRDRLKKLGLNDFKSQSEFIYKSQFDKAVLEGFTAATIAIGALLVIANSKSLARAFNDMTDNDKAKEAPTRS